jgi:sulfite reductase beta subunit-like hemoprotein
LTSEGKSTPAYNIFIRDSAESDSALGELVQRGIRAEQAKFALANLIEAYIKNKVNMSFNEFCKTKSLEELQAIINSKLNAN